MTSRCPCSGLGSSAVYLVVDRPYYPSAGETTERKKTCLCPCACPPREGKPMTEAERLRMLKAKIVGNCCASVPCEGGRRAYPAGWVSR